MDRSAPRTTGGRRRPQNRAAVYRRRRAGALLILLVLLAGVVAQLDAGERPTGSTAGGPVEPVRLTMSFSGDLLIHSPVFFAAQANAGGDGYDFDPMLAPIRRWVRGSELSVCHVETPIGAGPPAGEPLFNAPPELAGAISRTGWDACTTASNHTLDYGQEGVDATLRELDRAGVEHTGSYTGARASRRPLITSVGGVRVALLAYTTDTNGIPLPNEWTLQLFDPDRAIEDARDARRRGADVVVVSVHWASEMVPEYVSEPAPAQRRAARKLARAPEVSAVVGQGPHVVQPIEWIEGKPVAYSAGNLLSNQSEACCAAASQDGILVLLDLLVDGEGDRVEGVRYVPVWVSRPDYAVLPVGPAIADGAADEAALRASWERTTEVVGRGPDLKPVPSRIG